MYLHQFMTVDRQNPKEEYEDVKERQNKSILLQAKKNQDETLKFMFKF